MQFLLINEDLTLSQLSDRVGERNVEYILSANNLTRTPRVGKQFQAMVEESYNSAEVDWQRKSTILNTFTDHSDIFEKAALLNENGWKTLSTYSTFPDALRIPESITISDGTDVLGDSDGVTSVIYRKAMEQLSTPPYIIDPGIFNEYSTMRNSTIFDTGTETNNPIQGFNLPWGKVTLYSSLSDTSMDIPCYPQELEDSRTANYTTMPDLLYQYEPWYMYETSGPRQVPFTFELHRDMWTGDHRDGKCNQLIRFCEANCFPRFRGSAVNVPSVTLYVNGDCLISGIMTEVNKKWSGPLGLDGFYLYCELTLNITEVSKTPLNYDTVMNKSLIG